MASNFLCYTDTIVIYYFLYSGFVPRVTEMKGNASFAFSGLWLGLKYSKRKSYLMAISAFAVGKDALN